MGGEHASDPNVASKLSVCIDGPDVDHQTMERLVDVEMDEYSEWMSMRLGGPMTSLERAAVKTFLLRKMAHPAVPP